MGNRFCVILNEGDKRLTFCVEPTDKIYRIKQGHLLIGEDTPHKTFTKNNESWHIIGHIDNLPLLNYLLYSHYPSHHECISEDIICAAVKRYGMRIIELLHGNFCIIYEDSEGNLTLVTDESQQRRPQVKGGQARAGEQAQYSNGDTLARFPVLSYPMAETAQACQSPQVQYNNQRHISITRWRENHLQFIQSFRRPLYSGINESRREEYKESQRECGVLSFLSH